MFRNRLGPLLLASILACATACSVAHAQPTLQPANDLTQISEQARRQHVPVLIAFTQAGCPYCAKVKRSYLIPLGTSAAWGNKVVMREVDIDSTTAVRDFVGRETTQREFARQHHITLVPTLMIFNARGEQLAEPLIGLTSEDFYGFYLERLIQAGWDAMQARQ
jgi:thioredoxin-related protein